MNTFEIIGILGTILFTSAYLPTVIRIIRQKSFDTVSTRKLLLYITAAICWGLYGVRVSSPSLVITSVIALVAAGVLLLLKVNCRG